MASQGSQKQSKAGSGAGTMLAPLTSWQGHKDQIYAMCFDPKTRTLVTGGKEGVCLVWNSEGRIQHRLDSHGRLLSMTL